uniref:Skp1 domain-containing protein n=1 Tax=Rhabditophanes sp. KR3021 TaxID=114890 RepID=A0AC35TKL9_9BILA
MSVVQKQLPVLSSGKDELYPPVCVINQSGTLTQMDIQEYNFCLILAADFLDMTNLFTLLCGDVADAMRGKTTEELREMYDIEDDFTQEDRDMLAKQNDWIDE